MESLRVLIAEDHTLVAEGLQEIIELEPDMEIVGWATNGREAVDLVHRLEPDVVLMDIKMPQMDGITATRQLQDENASTKVVMLTMFEDEQHVFQAIRAGAHGYLLKDVDHEELVTAIRRVASNESILDTALTRKVLGEFKRLAQENEQLRQRTNPCGLTNREVEILGSVAHGMSNKEIARHHHISEKTVKTHLHRIFEKINVADRTQAALFAVEQDLL